MTQEKLLSRIQKLLRMAEGAEAVGNTAEAEAFAAKVQELLLKHHITMTDIEAVETGKKPITHGDVGVGDLFVKSARRKNVAQWQKTLARAVAEAHLCDWAYITNAAAFLFAGREQDREVAQWVFVTLVRMAIRDATRAYNKARKTGDAGPGFRVSFWNGFAARIHQRYREEEDRIRAEAGKSTALVRLDTARKEARRYIKEALGATYTKPKRTRQQYNATAVQMGVDAANRAPLRGRGVGSGGGQRQLQ